jgi:Holliday junction resolvasome RuvABC endonuclease subunit
MMSGKVVLGIDGGLHGAICALGGVNGPALFDMPVVGKNINIPTLVRIIKNLDPNIVFVEQQQPFRKQGLVSTFTTGRNHGAIIGMLATLYIPTYQVRPAEWKKGLGVSKDKETSRKLAIELYPSLADQLSRKKDHDRAEAALIATWGHRQWAIANDNDIFEELRNAS